MNARLKNLFEYAEAKLNPVAQDHLIEIVESFVSTWNDNGDFTPEELTHLRKIEAELFDPASAKEVAAFFAAT